MSFFYLCDDDKERCFVYYAKGTIFQDEPAYVTAYDICNGLMEHFNEVEADACRFSIPLRDASSGRHFTVAATPTAIDKMISWLRTKHYIFYTPVLDLDTVLGFDGLSHRVKTFWDIEDRRKREAEREDQDKLEEYCKNDPACSLSLKKLHNQYLAHHVPPVTYSFPLDKPVGRVTNTHIGQPGEGIRIDIELNKPVDKTRSMAFIEELWRTISDEPVPEIKTGTDQIKFYNKVLRTVVKYKNELINLRKDNDALNAELLELRNDHDTLTTSYARLWEDKERKKRMLNSFYGATCGATADAYGEVQRLKKERDDLKEERDNLVERLKEIDEYGYGGYVCSGCKRTTCGYFTEILSSLGVKNAVVYPARGQSKVECFAKLANERAQAVMKENRVMTQTIDTHVERLNNQEEIIKTQNKSLTAQARQLKDLGVALGNVKNTVDFEIDTLMADHGDEIIPEF